MKKIIIVAILLISTVVYYFFFTNKVNSWEIINQNSQGDTIVAFGDSLTAGYGAAKDKSYPAQLSQLINKPIINMGISGETTAEALQRIDSVIAQNPRIVLITLGGNDLKKEVAVSEFSTNLQKIIRILQQNGALVIIGGLDIPYYGSDYKKAYYDIAEKNGAILVPDVLDDIWSNKQLMSDAVHPNAKGYKIMAEHFYDALPTQER